MLIIPLNMLKNRIVRKQKIILKGNCPAGLLSEGLMSYSANVPGSTFSQPMQIAISMWSKKWEKMLKTINISNRTFSWPHYDL